MEVHDEPTDENFATMKPSAALELHRETIRCVIERNGARNARVFGSVCRGDDDDESDLDLLVDPIDGVTTLASLVRIKREVEAITGVATDVTTPLALSKLIRQSILDEAVPL